MSLPSIPCDGSITVTKELAEYYHKPITDFTDTEDVTCIEITSYEVSLDIYPHLLFHTYGLHRRPTLF